MALIAELLHDALREIGYDPSHASYGPGEEPSAELRGNDIYFRRHDGADWRYLGAVEDAALGRAQVQASFESY